MLILRQILSTIIGFFKYAATYSEDVLLGGVTIVGVVIVLMGLVKNAKPIKNIHNKTFKKIILAWLSILVTVALTIASAFLNELKSEYVLGMCILNAAGTVLMYWTYEYTAIRNLVELIGRHTIGKLFRKIPKSKEEVKETISEIQEEVGSLLDSFELDSMPQYIDEDLKNL